MTTENDLGQALTNVVAEQSVIGGLLVNPTRLDDVRGLVTFEEFFNMRHRDVFHAMCELADDNQPVDIVTVCERISANRGQADLPYLIDLHRETPSTANIIVYAQMVKECALKRQVVATANSIAREAVIDLGLTASGAIEMAQSRIMELGNYHKMAGSVEINNALKKYIDHLDYLHSRGDQIDGLACGLGDVDARINGYKPGLIVIAGRPSQGKTTLALCMAEHFSVRLKKRGLYFSLEMGVNELMQKLIASVGRIPLNNLKRPAAVGGEFWPKVSAAVSQCKDAPLEIVDVSQMHLNQMKAYARKAHRRQPLDYLIVDHMHLMDGDGDRNVDKFGSISRGMKQLSKELDIPVFALAQLSRKLEDRGNRRPVMSDLRESGRIEEDADIIHFVYRDEYYDPQTSNPGVMELNTAKFRNGEVGVDRLAAQLHISRVDNLAPGQYSEPPPPVDMRKVRERL